MFNGSKVIKCSRSILDQVPISGVACVKLTAEEMQFI